MRCGYEEKKDCYFRRHYPYRRRLRKETVTQPDGETRLIVERTTEIYGNPVNSLGINQDTKLLDSAGKNILAKDIPMPG